MTTDDIKGWAELALLVIGVLMLAARWVSDRESGERVTSQTIKRLESKDQELCDWQTEHEKVHFGPLHDKFNRMDGKFSAYVPRQEHDKDIAHLRDLLEAHNRQKH